jgi:hypothetical protein
MITLTLDGDAHCVRRRGLRPGDGPKAVRTDELVKKVLRFEVGGETFGSSETRDRRSSSRRLGTPRTHDLGLEKALVTALAEIPMVKEEEATYGWA